LKIINANNCCQFSSFEAIIEVLFNDLGHIGLV
jgi:hypothetical protein